MLLVVVLLVVVLLVVVVAPCWGDVAAACPLVGLLVVPGTSATCTELWRVFVACAVSAKQGIIKEGQARPTRTQLTSWAATRRFALSHVG